MLSRFRHYGWIVGSFAAVGAVFMGGCGGTSDTAKTPAVDTSKMPAGEQKSSTSADETKPDGADAKAAKAAEKERFALPNVEFMAPEDRKKVTLAGKEITSEACLLDTSVPAMKDEWFSNAIYGLMAAPDGSLYVYDNEKKVRHYIPEPGDRCKLAIDKSFGEQGMLKFPKEPDRVTMLADGTLVGIAWHKIQKYVGGQVETVECDVEDLFPDGNTGFTHMMDEVKKVDVAAECTATDWKYNGWIAPKPEKGKDPEKYNVQSVRPLDKDFLIHMTMQGDHYLGIHSPDGKLKVKLGKDRDKDKNVRDGEDICWAADMGKCGAGLCVLDSNCRRLSAWDPKKGEMIQAVELSDMIGLSYPWPVALAYAPKGVAYMAVTNKERKPENAPEGYKEMSHALIFRIKGLN